MTDPDELRDMVQDCKNRERKLTSWEIDFLSSIEDWLGAQRPLTEKQEETLERIWDRVTS